MIRKYRRSFALCLKATSLLVSLSSGYGRAVAGTCSESGGSYFCSGAANPGVDATVIIDIAQPLTVTTTSDFGINNSTGDAFNLTSTGGGLTFTDNHMATITGFEDGIVAINDGTADLSITTTGTVTGTNNAGVGIGIWADNRAPGNDLNISAANVSGGDDGINANNSGSGHLWITSTGPIEGTSDTGILANNAGTDLIITAAQVTGGAHGIVTTNQGTSSLSITATDTVTGGAYGMGIWANNFGTDLTLTAADVSGGDKGILATNSGSGHLWITTSGTVTSTGNGDLAMGIYAKNYGNEALSITASSSVSATGTGKYAIGIYARNSSNSTDLTISTAGVTGGYAGIFANNLGDGTLSITASGPVTGTRRFGIYANNSGTDLTLTAAEVTGSLSGIHALNAGSGALSITASGAVTATGILSRGISAKNSTTGSDLTISAAEVTGGSDGIWAANYGSGALSITASGAVTGTLALPGITSHGIYARNNGTGTDLTISAAEVTGGSDGIWARNDGSGALSITASGAVTGTSDFGISASNFGSDLTISAAEVTGGLDGIHAWNAGSGALLITASGAVTGASNYYGIRANNYGTGLIISVADVIGGLEGIQAWNAGSGALSITASGAVTGASNYGVLASNFGGDLTISAAEVTGGLDGIHAYNAGSGALSITTSGAVTGTSRAGIYAVNDGGQSTTINVGAQSLVQGGYAGIEVASGTGQSATINVSGQVSNLSGLTTDSAIVATNAPTTVNLFAGSVITGAIDLSTDHDTVTLAGVLDGSLKFNDGNDTFIQVGGSSLSGTADGGVGNDLLGFDTMGAVNASNYLNFENLGIYGGSTTLTGTWDFSTGTTTIYQGNLSIDGSLNTSLLTVASGATLSGNGIITGNMMVYGTVSPGHSIGTQTVTGDVTFASGSTFVAELAADGRADLLQVTGQVAIDAGAQLLATLEPGLYANGTSWQILTATDGVNGSFSSVAIDLSSVVLSVQQINQGDALELILARMPYADFARTSNQWAVGSALDTILPNAQGSMAELLATMDWATSPAQITAALAALNPEMYTAFAPSGLEIAGAFNRRVALRQQESALLASVPTDTPEEPLWSLWGQGMGDWLDRNAENGVVGYTLQAGGVVFGMDRQFGSRVRAGVAAGYDSGTLSWDDSANDGQIDGASLGVYGGMLLDGFHFDGSIGYTSLDNSADRRIATATGTTRTTSDFNSGVWEASLSGGYDFVLGSVRLGPVVAIDYQHLDQDGFSERGDDDFAVRANDESAESLTSSLGLRLTGRVQRDNWLVQPSATVDVAHQFQDDAMALTSHFVKYPGASFTVFSAEPADTMVRASLGLTAAYTENLVLSLQFSTTLADDQNAQLLTGGLTWKF